MLIIANCYHSPSRLFKRCQYIPCSFFIVRLTHIHYPLLILIFRFAHTHAAYAPDWWFYLFMACHHRALTYCAIRAHAYSSQSVQPLQYGGVASVFYKRHNPRMRFFPFNAGMIFTLRKILLTLYWPQWSVKSSVTTFLCMSNTASEFPKQS